MRGTVGGGGGGEFVVPMAVFDLLVEAGLWCGGYVEGLGYAAPAVTVFGTCSGSSVSIDWPKLVECAELVGGMALDFLSTTPPGCSKRDLLCGRYRVRYIFIPDRTNK